MSVLSLIGRHEPLFGDDLHELNFKMAELVSESKFLVLGGAGSIGQAVAKEIFKKNPRKLHIVDISENNLVELVRDIRSSIGYIDGNFETFALDIGSLEYDCFIEADGEYDYVLNLSAMKHVRSERDPFTLMRMIDVNIFNTNKTLQQSIDSGIKKYFCVSTDKAANPINMMGGSKRIMEMFLMRQSEKLEISTARFANVAFSDGSLLHGFNQRIDKSQPITAPTDIKRYFLTSREAGQLCLLSCMFGENRDIFFPKINKNFQLVSLSKIAERYVISRGFQPYFCKNEHEARELSGSLPAKGLWPCLFEASNTTGEKDFEEFHTSGEKLDLQRFTNIGVIKNDLSYDSVLLDSFNSSIHDLKQNRVWKKEQLVKLFENLMPHFQHKDIGKHLDNKM